ncbi:hypothetical protein [Klebsiella phage RothC]|uniref:Uncharacterized protein n=2 Tax=Viruses TaxID=10239 RepID=A0AB39BYV4_9CAUD
MTSQKKEAIAHLMKDCLPSQVVNIQNQEDTLN